MEDRRILAELSVEKMTRRVGPDVPARIPSNEIAGSASYSKRLGREENVCKETRRRYLASRRSWQLLILYGDRDGRRVDESNGNW